MQAAIPSTRQPGSRPAAAGDRLAGAVGILIVFLPVLATFLYVVSLSVEAPFVDDWDVFVPAFHHQAEGHLQWSDINAQHTESLIVFPLAASLILAKITGGRLLAITYLSYLFLCGALGVLFLFFRMLRLPGRWSVLWFLPASLLFLGWGQWEGLLWSTYLVNTMALFFILASLYCCTRVSRAPIFFPAAVACGWIASFSMASGLLVWFSGAVALVGAGTGKLRFEERLRLVAGWLIVGAVCVACFFFDIGPHPVPWPTGIHYVLANPGAAVRYALTYLGGPLASPSLALYAGIALVLLALPITFLALRKIGREGVAPGLLMALYVGTALIPLLDRRLGLGVGQASASRYVTAAALAPLGIYFCSLGLARTVPASRYLTAAMILLMAFGIVNSYQSGLIDGRRQWKERTACAAAIKDFRHIDSRRLVCAYPDPGVVFERAPLLQRDHLSLFAQ